MNNNSCKYYTERTLGWMLNNKTIVILSLLSFSLFVSTLAIAGQRNRLHAELEEMKAATTVAPAPSDPTPAPEVTTLAPTTTAPATNPPADPPADTPPADTPPADGNDQTGGGGDAGRISKSSDDDILARFVRSHGTA